MSPDFGIMLRRSLIAAWISLSPGRNRARRTSSALSGGEEDEVEDRDTLETEELRLRTSACAWLLLRFWCCLLLQRLG